MPSAAEVVDNVSYVATLLKWNVQVHVNFACVVVSVIAPAVSECGALT